MSIAQKLTTIAENQQKVYEAGVAVGRAEGDGGSFEEGYNEGFAEGFDSGWMDGVTQGLNDGYDSGLEEGKQAEYDAFWNVYQENGNRADYRGAFSGNGWTDEMFKPKYNMRPSTINGMFTQSAITDLQAALDRAGVTLDFTGITSNRIVQGFNDSKITRIGVVNVSHLTTINYLFFYASYLHTVDKLILAADGSTQTPSTAFQGCGRLENIIIEGTIGTSISFPSCPLTTESVQSIIDHLKDLTGQATQNLTLHNTVGSKLTDAQKAAITAKNWTLVY